MHPARRTSVGSSLVERPFLDPVQIPGLYADQHRVALRSTSPLSAKVEGAHVGSTVADLAAAELDYPESRLIADIGCGGGRTARLLALRFPDARLLAIDASLAMLAQARSH